MKMNPLILGMLISISVLLLSTVPLKAVPYSGVKSESPTFDVRQFSRKEMEKKLGRKMKWKERFAFRWMKRQITKKKKRKRDVVIIGLGHKRIKGNLIKANRDSLYLINFNKEKIPSSYSSYLKGETLVIPVDQTKRIKLLNSKRKGKLKGPIIVFSALIVGGLIALPFVGKPDNSDDDLAFLETLYLLFAIAILALILSILLVMNSIPKARMFVYGDPDQLDMNALFDHVQEKNIIVKSIRFFLVSFLFFLLSNNCQAVPTHSFQLIEKSSVTEMSRKQMEQQLGRKMTLKERVAFWLAKKKSKAKKGLLISEKVLFTVLLILLLILTIWAIIIDSVFAKRDGTPRQIWPTLLLVIDLGLIYFILSRPTRKEENKKEKEMNPPRPKGTRYREKATLSGSVARQFTV